MKLPLTVKTKTSLALIATLVLWSSSLVGIRIGLGSFDAGSLALLRFITASLCMLFFLLKLGRYQKPTLKELVMIFLSGVIGFAIYNIALNQGEMTIDPGTASFILSQIPVAIIILATIFLQERLNLYGWLGICISMAGIILVALGKSVTGFGGVKVNIGIGYLLIAIFCHATYAILHKPFLRKFNPVEFTTYAMWGGTLALLYYMPSLYREIPHASTTAIFAGLYIGVFPAAIGYITWGYALKHMPASKAGSIFYAQPIATTLFSWILLGEIPALLPLLGGVIALVGAFIVNQSFKMKVTQKLIIDEL